jgi:sulfate transport system permease protein
MDKHVTLSRTAATHRVGDQTLTRALLIGGVLFVTLFVLIAPLAIIFTQAFSAGVAVYVQNLSTPDTLHAI